MSESALRSSLERILHPASFWEVPGWQLFSRKNQTEVLTHAAWKRGCSVVSMSGQLNTVRFNNNCIHFTQRMSNRTSVFARFVTDNKHATKQLLNRSGVTVPLGRKFPVSEKKQAWKYACSLDVPVVIKPLSAHSGRGVSVGITKIEDFDLSWQVAAKNGKTIIVEPMIEGGDHRVFVIQDKVVAAARRYPASVTGDGVHTIRQLVTLKARERESIPYIGKNPLKLTDVMLSHMQKTGLTPETIPHAGQRVELHPIANISAGGESEDITNIIHPSFCEIAIKARQSIPDLFHAGIDIIAKDITTPANEQAWAVIEVNSNPDISLHHFPSYGQARDVAGALIESLLPETAVKSPSPRHDHKIRVTGRVQGVGFRHWLRRQAHVHAVDGWVRNAEDGSIQAVLSGSRSAVESVLTLCKTGPKSAKVYNIEVHSNDFDANRAQNGFLIIE